MKPFNIFFTYFYLFVTFCLPQGNFASIQDLPNMYRHCKATEDKDMTILDFITDHLINIDGLFDKHNDGDEQKPHRPVTSEHNGQLMFCYPNYSFTTKHFNFSIEVEVLLYPVSFHPTSFIAKIFRPPIIT